MLKRYFILLAVLGLLNIAISVVLDRLHEAHLHQPQREDTPLLQSLLNSPVPVEVNEAAVVADKLYAMTGEQHWDESLFAYIAARELARAIGEQMPAMAVREAVKSKSRERMLALQGRVLHESITVRPAPDAAEFPVMGRWKQDGDTVFQKASPDVWLTVRPHLSQTIPHDRYHFVLSVQNNLRLPLAGVGFVMSFIGSDGKHLVEGGGTECGFSEYMVPYGFQFADLGPGKSMLIACSFWIRDPRFTPEDFSRILADVRNGKASLKFRTTSVTLSQSGAVSETSGRLKELYFRNDFYQWKPGSLGRDKVIENFRRDVSCRERGDCNLRMAKSMLQWAGPLLSARFLLFGLFIAVTIGAAITLIRFVAIRLRTPQEHDETTARDPAMSGASASNADATEAREGDFSTSDATSEQPPRHLVRTIFFWIVMAAVLSLSVQFGPTIFQVPLWMFGVPSGLKIGTVLGAIVGVALVWKFMRVKGR